MEASIEHLHKTFATLRAGGANPGLLDSVRVECYGTQSELRTVASVTAPDKRNLIVRPFDHNILPEIEKALLKSKVGLTPQREGKIIRLPVPPLTEERRLELSKQAREIAESQKVAIRNVRRDILRAFQAPTEDAKRDFEARLDALTKTYTGKVDEAVETKQASLLDLDNRWDVDPNRRKR